MVALLVALPLVPGLAAGPYTGSLTYAGGDITRSSEGDSAYVGDMAWTVTDLGGTWQYEYDLTTSVLPGGHGGGLSHVIIEITPDSPAADFTYQKYDGTNWVNWTLGSGSTIGNQLITSGNPGMPADMWGIRFANDAPPGPSDTHWLWRILTDHQPVWGDFFAKDGLAGTFYNADAFDDGPGNDWADDPADAAANGSIHRNILVPDGRPPVTPELSSGMLLLLGMLPVGLAWRRRRKA